MEIEGMTMHSFWLIWHTNKKKNRIDVDFVDMMFLNPHSIKIARFLNFLEQLLQKNILSVEWNDRLIQKFGQNLGRINENNQEDRNHSIQWDESESIKVWQKATESLLKTNKVRKRQFSLSFSVFSDVLCDFFFQFLS